MLNCAVDRIMPFYTLFLTRFRTYKIAAPPQTKMTSKDDIKGFVYLTRIATPSRVYLIDTGNEGRARDARTPEPHPPVDLFLTGGRAESR
jgi:hypothetical protein